MSNDPFASSVLKTQAMAIGTGGPARVVFDLTTTAMWSGPPAGIVRVESEFARWALDHLEDVVFAFFNPDTLSFCHVSREMAKRLTSQDAFVDTRPLMDPSRRRGRKTDRIPVAIKPFAMWILQSRRMALQALERIRLSTENVRIASLADAMQRLIINDKYPKMVRPDGSRRACFPIDMAVGPPIEFQSGDTLVCTGAGWVYNDIMRAEILKRDFGIRFVLFCHDIISLMFPQYFKEIDVEAQRAYCSVALPASDLVVFSSRTVEADTRAYCSAHRLGLGKTAICPLGASISVNCPAGRLPEGLEPGHYALLVSTIEPRKGHRLIYEVWKDLLASGVPQSERFKLVFAGREGWMAGDLMCDLRAASDGSLRVFNDADDGTLATLYKHAAFCLYPSRYEGFGLPVVEAFFHGKAVLASTGGAVPEVVRDFSPCLEPNDIKAWHHMLQTWIKDPAARAPYEQAIRTSFCHPNWDESAKAFFSLVQNLGHDF